MTGCLELDVLQVLKHVAVQDSERG